MASSAPKKKAPALPKSGRRKDDAKRQAILDAARDLFMQCGLDAVSMDDIARSAAVSKATLYSHFPDKDGLFQVTIIEVCTRYTTEDDIADYTRMKPADALQAFGLNLYQLILSEEAVALFRIMVAESGRHPKISRLFYEAGPRRVKDYMAGLLKHYHRQKLLRVPNPQAAIEQFGTLIKGEHHMRVVLGLEKRYNTAQAKAHVRSCVDGFLKIYATKS